MPLPFILAGAAIAAAGVGAKKAYDGYQNSSEADDIVDREKQRYEKEENIFRIQDETTNKSLDRLGKLQLSIGQNFAEFQTISKSLVRGYNYSNYSKRICCGCYFNRYYYNTALQSKKRC